MATKSPFITTAIPVPTPPTGDAASFGARLKANSAARVAASDAATKERAAACAQPMSFTRSTN